MAKLLIGLGAGITAFVGGIFVGNKASTLLVVGGAAAGIYLVSKLKG